MVRIDLGEYAHVPPRPRTGPGAGSSAVSRRRCQRASSGSRGASGTIPQPAGGGARRCTGRGTGSCIRTPRFGHSHASRCRAPAARMHPEYRRCAYRGTPSLASGPSPRARRRGAHGGPSSSAPRPRCGLFGSSAHRRAMGHRAAVSGTPRHRMHRSHASRHPASPPRSAPQRLPALSREGPSSARGKAPNFDPPHDALRRSVGRPGHGARRGARSLCVLPRKAASGQGDRTCLPRGGAAGLEGHAACGSGAAARRPRPGVLLRPGHRLRPRSVSFGYPRNDLCQGHAGRGGAAHMARVVVGGAPPAPAHDPCMGPARHGDDRAHRLPRHRQDGDRCGLWRAAHDVCQAPMDDRQRRACAASGAAQRQSSAGAQAVHGGARAARRGRRMRLVELPGAQHAGPGDLGAVCWQRDRDQVLGARRVDLAAHPRRGAPLPCGVRLPRGPRAGRRMCARARRVAHARRAPRAHYVYRQRPGRPQSRARCCAAAHRDDA